MSNCYVKDCKSVSETDPEIKFYNFPFQNEKTMKFWIAATGRDNWTPPASAQLCNLHFNETDYYDDTIEKRLKPDVIPTQNIHENILEVFQQDKMYEINRYKDIVIVPNQEASTSGRIECLDCPDNFDVLLNENEQLKQKIDEIKELQDNLLGQQAGRFRAVMNNKEIALKSKLKMVKETNKTLVKHIQRQKSKIKLLKELISHLNRQSGLKHNATNKFENLEVSISGSIK